MGKNNIEKPERLAEKLRRIRLKLGLSQAKMTEALGRYGANVHRSSISSYENDDRLPTPMAALAYARLAKTSIEVLVDDERDLPKGF